MFRTRTFHATLYISVQDSSLHCRSNLLRGQLLEIVVTTLATPMGHLKSLPAPVLALLT